MESSDESPGSTGKNVQQDGSGGGSFARLYRDAAPYLALGVQLAATVVIMFYAGKWADGYFGTSPWLMIVGLMLGAIAGLYNFFKTVIDLGKKESAEVSQKKP